MDSGTEVFLEETGELLDEMTAALLELEQQPENTDIVNTVFRAMHTIKGSAAMYGFADVGAFTHDIETVYDKVRSGALEVTQELIDITLSAADIIRDMVFGTPEDTGGGMKLSVQQKFASLLRDTDEKPQGDGECSQTGSENSAAAVTYRIRFTPRRDIFLSGTNPVMLIDELRALGECSAAAHTNKIPLLDVVEPDQCYVSWDIVLTSSQGIDAIKDVFIFVEDSCDLTIDVIDDGDLVEGEEDYKKLGEILLERGDVTADTLTALLGKQQRIGDMLIDAGAVDPEHVAAAAAEQEHVRSAKKKRQMAENAASVRVSAEKIDELVDLVGEIITVQAGLTQIAGERNDPELSVMAEEVERLTSRLRENTMSIRMLPIGTLFGKFKRVVRDLAKDLGKEVQLITVGGETELDKTVIEQLNDPLVHLIRNSVDHGIESPDEREAVGKPRQGTVTLCAEHSGDHVLIVIEDDGGGMDAEKIKVKAVERGMIGPDAGLGEQELQMLVFEPGFSTAGEITSVSGRGVGLDVVKRNIDSMRGSIDIESRQGRGTILSLKIPLTLAIIDGMLVQTGDEKFIVPLGCVVECLEMTHKDIENAHGNRVINVRDHMTPYISIRERFAINGDIPEVQRVVLCEVQEKQVGFAVDRVIGNHQTVIKPLGEIYGDVHCVSGATILGDGTVALILDTGKLAEYAHSGQ